MARSGRFGRLPRVAPDLTSAIVAMMREYEAYREQGLVDAWKNGGTFEGKPVTDDMVTGFYEKRLKDLAPNDPQYENTRNTVTQYGFTIANSKQELLYAQHKVGDGAMVSFYTSWAAKMPVDSEAYRNLMRLAAQYADRGRTASSRGAGAAKESSYNAAVVATYPGMVVYNTMKSVLEALARREGILGPASNDPTKSEGLKDLYAFQGDNGRLLALADALAHSPQYAPVRDQITKWLRANGAPGFNGDFSWQAFMGSRVSYMASLAQQQRLAQQNGKKEDYNAATKAIGEADALAGKLNLVPAMKLYEDSYTRTQAVLDDPSADPFTKWLAVQAHKAVVTDAYNTAADLNNDLGFGTAADAEAAQGGFRNELAALNGQEVKGPTVWDTGKGSPDSGGSTTDAAETSTAVRGLMVQIGGLINGDTVLTTVDSKGNPVSASDPAAIVKPVLVTALQGADVAWVPSVGAPATIDMTNPDGSSSAYATGRVLTAVVGQTVTSVGQVFDNAGRVVATIDPKTGTSPAIGSVYTMPDGTALYGFVDKDGNRRYTYQNPFVSAPKPDGKGGWTVGPPNLAMPKPGVKTQYDPVQGYQNDFYSDPDAVSAYHSLHTAWMMGTKGIGGKGVYKADRNGTDLALAHEFQLGVDPRTGAYVGTDQQMALYTAAKNEVDAIRASVIRGDDDIQTQLVTNWTRGIGGPYSAMGREELAAVGRVTLQARTGEGKYDTQGGAQVPVSYSGALQGTPQYAVEEKYFRDRALLMVGAKAGIQLPADTNKDLPIEQFRKWVFERTGNWMTDVTLFGQEKPAVPSTIAGEWGKSPYTNVPGQPGIPPGANVIPFSPVLGPPIPGTQGAGTVTPPPLAPPDIAAIAAQRQKTIAANLADEGKSYKPPPPPAPEPTFVMPGGKGYQ